MALLGTNDHPIDPIESRLLISELQRQVRDLSGGLKSLTNLVVNSPQGSTTAGGATPQAVNQIRNGTYSHSVNSWADDATADNGRYECAWWYSHPIVDGQAMFRGDARSTDPTLTWTNTDVSTGADTITITNHGLQTGLGFRVTTAGTLPAPLAINTTYFVIRVDANTIQVASSYANAIAGTELDLTTTGAGVSTLTYNYTLKDSAHTVYSEGYANWQISTGSARFTDALTDISGLLPGNNIEAGYTYYAVFSIAKANQYVSANPSCRIFAGLYAKSTAKAGWSWLYGSYDITATVLGTVGTPTEREYAVFVQTDRGITLITSTLTVASAPSNADYAGGARVVLTWPRPLGFGVTSYAIYRNTPTDFLPGAVSITPVNTIAITGINLTTAQPIVFAGADLPDPLVAGTVYYAIRVDNDTFQVATSIANANAGTEINLIDAGTGTHTLNVYLQLFTQNGITYIDNNAFQNTASGFPAADYNELVAYTATVPNVVAQLGFIGDPLFAGWQVIPYAIRIPQNYDKSDTELNEGQWLRWGLTENLSLRITNDITMTNGINDVVSTVSQFRVDLIGLNATITDKGGNEITGTVTAFTDANNIQIADNWPFPTTGDCTIFIEFGAPPNSLLIDLSHLTWIAGAGFSPNPEDISPDRGIPAAVPNGTTQGPIIIGQTPGGPDGTPACLYQDEMVMTALGEMPAIDLVNHIGIMLPDGYGGMNKLEEAELGVKDVWCLETENGATLLATDTKQIYVDHGATKLLEQLKKGDSILTMFNDCLTHSTIINKFLAFKQVIVVRIGLNPTHTFLAGTADAKVLVDNNKPIITGGPVIIGGPEV